MDDTNKILEILIKKIDDNPLLTLEDARKLSVDLTDQHFYVEKKLQMIID